jgi:hypothetical protein
MMLQMQLFQKMEVPPKEGRGGFAGKRVGKRKDAEGAAQEEEGGEEGDVYEFGKKDVGMIVEVDCGDEVCLVL